MKEISLDGMKLRMPDDFEGDYLAAFQTFLHEQEDKAYRQAVNDCIAALDGSGDAQSRLRTLLDEWEKAEKPPDVWLA